MAFVGAQKEVPVLNGDFDRLTEQVNSLSTGSFSETWYGVDVQWIVEVENMRVLPGVLISETEDVEGTYRIALEIKLT